MHIVGLVSELAKSRRVWVDTKGVEYLLKWDSWLECFTFGIDSVDDNCVYDICYAFNEYVIYTLHNAHTTLVVNGKVYVSM